MMVEGCCTFLLAVLLASLLLIRDTIRYDLPQCRRYALHWLRVWQRVGQREGAWLGGWRAEEEVPGGRGEGERDGVR